MVDLGDKRMRFFTVATVLVFLATVGAHAQGVGDSQPAVQGPVSYIMPQAAIDAHIDGDVTVVIDVDEKGLATDARPTSGPVWPCGKMPTSALEEFYLTLSEAMKKVRFQPAIKDGKAVPGKVAVKLSLKNPLLSPNKHVPNETGPTPEARMISGGVMNGRAKYLPTPGYPEKARALRESGAVSVKVLIDEKGKVARAGAVSGKLSLQPSSRQAACDAVFKPVTLEGKPVKVSGVITYNFVP